MLRMVKGSLRGIVGILWLQMKAQSIQLIMALESMMVVVVTMFSVTGETMTETGMYKDCFLQFRDLEMTEGEDGGD